MNKQLGKDLDLMFDDSDVKVACCKMGNKQFHLLMRIFLSERYFIIGKGKKAPLAALNRRGLIHIEDNVATLTELGRYVVQRRAEGKSRRIR